MNKLILITLILSLFLLACDNFYSAGNRTPGIDLELKSKISSKLVFRYLDSPDLNRIYALPPKYEFLKNGGDLKYNPENTKIIYFSKPREEAYVIGLFGYTQLSYVFIPSVNSHNFICDKDQLDNEAYNRIELRIDTLFKRVFELAKRDGVPDSLVFINHKKPFYVKLNRPND